mgnify:CR=1 FL=1|tara:strand:+ start:540 stop:926 length:387 start_codon:yes stop_codon:yes gene_type:complete
MNEKKLQEIVKKYDKKFKLLILDKIFKIDEITIYQNENPITESTTRGGVYLANKNEIKVKAVIFDITVTEYFSKAMLGPNKMFLDIFIEAKMEDSKKILLVTNLTNSMQNSSKAILYLTLKDAMIKSD